MCVIICQNMGLKFSKDYSIAHNFAIMKINHPPQKTLCGGWRCITALRLFDGSERRSVDCDALEIDHTHRDCLFTDE